MYLMKFVNAVRRAQGFDEIVELPPANESGSSIELAMGCRLEPGLIRLPSAKRAAEVSSATELPLGFDGLTVAMPSALAAIADAIRPDDGGDSLARWARLN